MKKGGSRRPVGQRQNANAENKDQDEDSLLLFRDMQKRDKERIISLLQPIQTDDMESNSGNYPLYRIPSAKKFGFDFLHESDKNDYDWLKTPPATPLFASLEMDASAPELVVQRELPILTHLSRFSGIPQDVPKMNSRSKSPNPKAKVLLRSPAQHTRPNTKSSWTRDTTSVNEPVVSIPDTNERLTTMAISKDLENPTEVPFNLPETNADVSARVSPPKSTVTSHGFSDETPPNLVTNRASSNLRGRPTTPSIQRQPVDQHVSNSVPPTNRSSSTSRGRPTTPSIGCRPRQAVEHPSNVVPITNSSSSTSKGRPSNASIGSSTPKQSTIKKDLNVRGVSPSKTAVTSSMFFDETPPPPNLITTSRPSSTSRTRPTTPSLKTTPKQDPIIQSRRQSCSPSMSRGRKTELTKQEKEDPTTMNTQKKNQGNGSLAFGSSMVEKVMNARKSISQESERKPRFSTTTNDNSGFGRFVSRSSVDMPFKNKNMEVNRDPVALFRANTVNNITSASMNSSLDLGKCTTQPIEGITKIQESWKRKETRRFSKN
ncbi:hypothetical protein FRX31_035367 [Thalictrum thalictroides]|uniref:Flocculation FLO11-like protein n=1 Tax=Thalictrum thalictroides TaxID=46969 RepID=A0A7J6US07_THATH|nr:hypothetical protein FRX31_035367 [Thalictrum thalictroides]